MLTVYEKELSPELHLWQAVICRCIRDILKDHKPKSAYEFLNNINNPFFRWVADYYGYTSDGFLERILTGIKRIEKHRGTLLNDNQD